MQPERWKQIEDLYQAAAAQPREVQAEFLRQACPADHELYAEVESLLKEAAEDSSFLDDAPASASEFPTVSLDPLDAAAGTVIGSYRLIRIIGEGGMGEVWLAEQKEPVRRRVAVKLIKAGMGSREVLARFESERQALALMEHPAIAKVFDAGSTAQGRPYLVMEYVSGIPITTYCDNLRLSTRDRLELFMHVCEGVQHAHQKAIIHRDLKPSNILVTEVDGHPSPKIIDFGVVKALSQKLTASTLLTRAGAFIGTPEYMSPEQALSSGEDIDTRSDVYSLGVIFYELLVGVPPLALRGAPLEELLRKLRDEDAPKPSMKFRTLDAATSSEVARRRQAVPTALDKQMRGDLDSIALKALEKDRSRRYGSPSDFAADISRYLRNEAVLAVPPSAAYRARKFGRRHRAGLITSCAFALVLISAAIISVWQTVRATNQRDRADAEAAVSKAISDFLQNDLLAQASARTQARPSSKPELDLKVRTALDRAAARISGKFDRQPEVEAAIRDTIGQTYMDLGLFPDARKQLERALELRRRVLGAENPATLRTMSRVGQLERAQGNIGQAQAVLRQAVEIQRRVLGPEHPDTLTSMYVLASTYLTQGKHAEAEALYSRTLEIRRRVLGAEHPDTLLSMEGLANVYRQDGKYARAEGLYEAILEVERRVLGSEHPDTLYSTTNLADIYIYQEKYARAETLYGQILEIQNRTLGFEHPATLYSMTMLEDIYIFRGKYSEAETLSARTLDAQRRVLGPEHSITLISMDNLADAYTGQGKYSQAEKMFSQTLAITRRAMGSENPQTSIFFSDFASMYQRQGKYALAEFYAAQALAGQRHTLGSAHPETMASAADLALAYLSQGRFAQSETLAREALNFNREKQPDHWQLFRAESLLGASLAGQKKYTEAEPLLTEGYIGMKQRASRIEGWNRYHLDRAHRWLVEVYQAWGKPEKAAEWKKK